MDPIIDALIYRYAKNQPTQGNTDRDTLIAFVLSIQSFSDTNSLLAQIKAQHPDWQLPASAIAILACVDACSKIIFKLTLMEPCIDQLLRHAIPRVAAHMLMDPSLPLSKKTTVLIILDRLSEGLIGWTPDLGLAGNNLRDKLQQSLQAISPLDMNASTINEDISNFLDKESNRILRLEQRLADTETGIMRSQQTKNLSAAMINRATQDKLISQNFIEFLHGPWHDSLQLIIHTHGINSEAWQRAEKLTETIVWTYQPIDPDSADAADQNQRLYSIIEHLPNEIKELLVALEHDHAAIDVALIAIEQDHVAIISDQQLQYVAFQPLPDERSVMAGSRVSRVLLRKIDALKTGQWFAFEEAGQPPIRIKLILKLDDINQLLFTNRNGMRVLQKSFAEFAYYLSSRVARPLNSGAMFSSTFSQFYAAITTEYEDYQKLIADRKIMVRRADQARDASRQKALQEANALASANNATDQPENTRQQPVEAEPTNSSELASQSSVDASSTSAARLNEYSKEVTQQVHGLTAGHYLKLRTKSGDYQQARLAVRNKRTDRMIFIDPDGIKIGEFNSQQLAQLLTDGEAQFNQDGKGFEDALAEVVTKLRLDRNKSYDDLTGK